MKKLVSLAVLLFVVGCYPPPPRVIERERPVIVQPHHPPVIVQPRPEPPVIVVPPRPPVIVVPPKPVPPPHHGGGHIGVHVNPHGGVGVDIGVHK